MCYTVETPNLFSYPLDFPWLYCVAANKIFRIIQQLLTFPTTVNLKTEIVNDLLMNDEVNLYCELLLVEQSITVFIVFREVKA